MLSKSSLNEDRISSRPYPNNRFKVWIAVFGCCLLFSVFAVAQRFTVQLQLQISSSTDSVAQLFANTGKGYDEGQSTAIPIHLKSHSRFEQLTFKLPKAKVYSLRFDPLNVEGTVVIKDLKVIVGSQEILAIGLSKVVPFNQIQAITVDGNQLVIKTAEHANDPGVQILLDHPLNSRPFLLKQKAALLIIGNLLLIALGMLLQRKLDILYTMLATALAGPHQRLQAIADQISMTDIIRFDAYALWFYITCCVVFVCTSMADLNGSSLGMYSVIKGQQPGDLLGTPRAIRSDEWAYHTPLIMNQCLRADRFALRHSAIGDHSAALIGCVPVKHISTLFRPQFWSFFVLPVDYAYAVYWQMKALLLLCGIFTWLLLITGSTFWSITGASWYFFSPFTQWTYSWSSLLPDSIGLICLSMVFACFLVASRNRLVLAISAVGLTSCTINFALCAYLPHLIPLVWLAIIFFAVWCVTNRAVILQTESRFDRVAALAGCVTVTALVGALIYFDAKDTIAGVSNTMYPGKRVYHVVSTTPNLLLSHFLDWTATDNHFPAVLGNICEGAGFLWLAPVTFFFAARLSLTRQKRAILISLWCVFFLLLIWMLFAWPLGLAKVLALDKTGYTRCVPALGLANIAIVSVCAAAYTENSSWKNNRKRFGWINKDVLLRSAGVFCLLLIILWQTNQSLGTFYKTGELLLATGLITLFVVLLSAGRTKELAFALVFSQAAAFGMVNPWQRGLKPVTDSAAFQYFQNHHELLRHKWIYFADGVAAPGFLEAMGCDEYTGLHLLPDIDHFRLFQAKGYNMALVNSLGYFLAHAIDSRSPSYIKEAQTGVADWYVSPADPIIKQLGIEYAAFDRRPDPSIAAGLVPLRDTPIDHIWLYRLP